MPNTNETQAQAPTTSPLDRFPGPTDEARELQRAQEPLVDAWHEARATGDEALIDATRAAYDASVQRLMALLGQDAPCSMVDLGLWSTYSDLFKSFCDRRPQTLLSRGLVLEFLNRPQQQAA